MGDRRPCRTPIFTHFMTPIYPKRLLSRRISPAPHLQHDSRVVENHKRLRLSLCHNRLQKVRGVWSDVLFAGDFCGFRPSALRRNDRPLLALVVAFGTLLAWPSTMTLHPIEMVPAIPL